jgi:hypothetical protein
MKRYARSFRGRVALLTHAFATRPQFQNILYITVNLPDIIPDTLKYELTPTTLSVAAKAGK